MKQVFGCVFWGLALVPALAQGPPAADIFLADLGGSASHLKLENIRNITDREGYDNQPYFLGNDRLLYTSIDNNQADIYRFDVVSGAREQLTDTPESEYSPTPMPDGRGFSVVRVEADGTQRLWRFPLDGGAPSLLLADVEPVGYHTWLGPDRVALFVLGEKPTLQWTGLREPQPKLLLTGIGRGMHPMPGENAVTAVRKPEEGDWTIEKLSLAGGESETLIATRPGSEDFVWTAEGAILMGQNSRLYQWRPGVDEGWVLVVDLATKGLSAITRLAISPDQKRLALVSAR